MTVKDKIDQLVNQICNLTGNGHKETKQAIKELLMSYTADLTVDMASALIAWHLQESRAGTRN